MHATSSALHALAHFASAEAETETGCEAGELPPLEAAIDSAAEMDAAAAITGPPIGPSFGTGPTTPLVCGAEIGQQGSV